MGIYSEYRVAVIGDVMLDVWYEAEEVRLSPEAAVLDIVNPRQKTSLGGAGNVAANAEKLGARCSVIGILGDDSPWESREVKRLCTNAGLIGHLTSLINRKTTTKRRYIARGHQMVRISEETRRPIIFNEQHFIDAIVDRDADAIIIADYNKGMMTPAVIGAVMDYARDHDIVTVVDPKYDNWECYRGCTIFKPNEAEADRVIKHGSYAEQAWKAAHKVDCDWCVLTLGSQGMVIGSKTDEEGHTDFPPRIEAKAVPVSNVCGAGDTVSAVLALEYLRTKDIFKAAELANYAASLVVQKPRTGTVTVEELSGAHQDRRLGEVSDGREEG